MRLFSLSLVALAVVTITSPTYANGGYGVESQSTVVIQRGTVNPNFAPSYDPGCDPGVQQSFAIQRQFIPVRSFAPVYAPVRGFGAGRVFTPAFVPRFNANVNVNVGRNFIPPIRRERFFFGGRVGF